MLLLVTAQSANPKSSFSLAKPLDTFALTETSNSQKCLFLHTAGLNFFCPHWNSSEISSSLSVTSKSFRWAGTAEWTPDQTKKFVCFKPLAAKIDFLEQASSQADLWIFMSNLMVNRATQHFACSNE